MVLNQVFANCKPRLSEAPIHFRNDGMLYWRGLDGEVFRKAYDGNMDSLEEFRLGIGNIGAILEQDDYLLLLGDDGGVYKWMPGNSPRLLRRYPVGLFNDCAVDPMGRLYCGVLAEHYFDEKKRGNTSLLVRIDTDGEMTILEELCATTPNGIGFSPEKDKMYFAVTDQDSVFVYDYNATDGQLTNKRVFATDCCPDGITVDEEGNVWVTDCREGGPVICYDPAGNIVETYELPIRRTTSVAFGGENMDILFVTTAHEGQPVGEYDGGVFMMKNAGKAGERYYVKITW